MQRVLGEHASPPPLRTVCALSALAALAAASSRPRAVSTRRAKFCGRVTSVLRARVEQLLLAEAVVAEYANISFEDYKGDCTLWQINTDFPGVQAIHRDPWIFVCSDLLSREECEALVVKASPHLKQSVSSPDGGKTWTVNEQRTSWDVRPTRAETPGLQKRFGELLNMPVEYMETLKVTRYKEGEYFKKHHDFFGGPSTEMGFPACPEPWANRVVTLFVYLADNASGGATFFSDIDLAVQPRQGMGVIHFPCSLPSDGGKDLEGVEHEGMPATSEKLLVVQWGWPAPWVEEQALRAQPTLCSSTRL